jgi:acyl-CoA dehydrogenase
MDQTGRDDLVAWRAEKSEGFFGSDLSLAPRLERYLGSEGTSSITAKMESFARAVVEVIEPAVEIQESSREFPRLRPFNGVGELVEEVAFHPAQRAAATQVWSSGLLSTTLDYAGAFEVAAQFFVLSHVGEGGQACPVVCTIGLRRALEHHASPEMLQRYLPGLTSRDGDVALRGSQFLTEIQGGSDVGANVARAVPDPQVRGAWRVSGEKWFCSVADADLFAVTARPQSAVPGTAGLGCFLIPRVLETGEINGFRIRRLKDKLGTRTLASAEIDFANALAWPIGDVSDGFKVAVSDLLNTSRWLNAVGSTGIMSRAHLEASSFARHRRAFGSSINAYPGVREQLAILRVEAAAALASTLALTDLVGKVDSDSASPDEVKIHRFLVNANKYVTSIAATDSVHRAIEVLGGNGTIEDFSALPRLYRDAIVFESWEGTHNVLCNQVRRDCARLGLLQSVTGWLHRDLDAVPAALAPLAAVISDALDRLLPGIDKSLQDSHHGDVYFRLQLTDLMHVIQATCLLTEAAFLADASQAGAVAALYVERHLTLDGRDGEPSWTRWVDAVV